MISTIAKLAWLFLKIGCIFFGGGYVLIPLLHRIMVDDYQWLTLRQFLDGMALSQLTPGPLAMLATFTGYRAGGFAGGLVATVFIFLPCTALMLFIARNYRRFRNLEMIRETLDGLLPAVVGLVAGAAFNLGKTSLLAPTDFVMLAAGLVLLGFTRLNPMVAILGAGAFGFFLGL
jgi:chromate transporter